MSVKKRDYGDLIVLMALACFTLWYLMDAIGASARTQNLLLILPLSLVILVIIALELVMRLKHGTLLHPGVEGEPLYRTLPVVGLFAAYVLSLETVGFDIATVLFIAFFLLLKGERNLWMVAGFSTLFGLGSVYFFAQMLPYPMTLLLLPS